jgi:hypothetical protein
MSESNGNLEDEPQITVDIPIEAQSIQSLQNIAEEGAIIAEDEHGKYIAIGRYSRFPLPEGPEYASIPVGTKVRIVEAKPDSDRMVESIIMPESIRKVVQKVARALSLSPNPPETVVEELDEATFKDFSRLIQGFAYISPARSTKPDSLRELLPYPHDLPVKDIKDMVKDICKMIEQARDDSNQELLKRYQMELNFYDFPLPSIGDLNVIQQKLSDALPSQSSSSKKPSARPPVTLRSAHL